MIPKLIFFDIDNTLLDDEKNLPESTKLAIQRLQDLGHIVAIASGRPPFNFKDLCEELNIDTHVSMNGQYVVYQNEVIYKNPLNKKTLAQLASVASRNEHPVVYVNHEDWRSNLHDHPQVNEAVNSLKIKRKVPFDPSYYQDNEIYQALLFCAADHEINYKQQFDQLDFIRWHEYSLDVMPPGGSKANGIKQAIKRIGVAPDHVYAFGDGLNDIEMMRFVRNSVAMGNAHDIVKKAAKHVTKDVHDDGIAYGLEMVGLL